MTLFSILVRVLDGIRSEAKASKHTKLYATDSKDDEAIWQSRSRAFIHLYLKVMYGLREFSAREQLVTDGSYDGGIDGYFIDEDNKKIVLIQSKLRRSESGFRETTIDVAELLSMQVARVLAGEPLDEAGQPYNGKIAGLQRNIGEIINLGKYTISIVVLANLPNEYSSSNLKRLVGGYEVEVFDFQRSYKELLFPVLTGNLFQARDITILLDLSNKGAGSKITYEAKVPGFDCDITVVFVPIIEIAKLMHDYKNSILKYNPRSYLEIAGAGVNKAITDTVMKSSGNDFALLSNGITLICDESSVSEQSGRKHKAQLYLKNPQIINGGQTAYTLSLIYDETATERRDATFLGQEVLVKIIALTRNADEVVHDSERRTLIERISTATNSQTAVSFADRVSGEDERLAVQVAVYERLGILVERKKGEFAEAVRSGYIHQNAILDRSLFQRLYCVANGMYSASLRKRVAREPLPHDVASNEIGLQRFALASKAYDQFGNRFGMRDNISYTQILSRILAVMCVVDFECVDTDAEVEAAVSFVVQHWEDFLETPKPGYSAFQSSGHPVIANTLPGQAKGGKRRTRRESAATVEAYFDPKRDEFAAWKINRWHE